MYEIMLGGQTVGDAQVQREGLYYSFRCVCNLSGEVVYRITVRCGENTQSLGIPVPQDGQYVLRTKLPVKKVGEGQLYFRAVPKHDALGERFIPLSPEEPFRYLRRLQESFLQVREGKVGLVIRDKPQMEESR